MLGEERPWDFNLDSLCLMHLTPLQLSQITAMVIAENGASNHMPSGNITKSTVDGLLPADRDQFLWDAKVAGFGVKITPKGAKVYLYQYRMGGRGSKVRRFTIGRHGMITAEYARKEAKRLAMQVVQGIDPRAEKLERIRVEVELAFPAYLEHFSKECLSVEWKASAREVEAMLRSYALPSLRMKSLPDITRSDIASILRALRSKPATAAKLFAVLRRLFRWAVKEGDLAISPMDGMEAPKPPSSRDRWLRDAEVLRVWTASSALGYPFGPMVRFLILSGARRNEVAHLSWDELNQEQKLWSLPASRAKNGEPNDIPLTALMVDELNVLTKSRKSAKWPKCGFVFSTNGKSPVSGFSRAKQRLDKILARGGESMEHWSLHDLRRTFATGMQRLGVRFEVTEAILNHKSGSRAGVAGIYQRHHWGPEKRAALQAWSDHIECLVSNRDDIVNTSKTLG
ncbi:MAG: site-specific integrase [Pseudomonadota bacterium]